MRLAPHTHAIFLIILGTIALAGIGAGVGLAIASYSSAGAFAVSSACVGVLGTLAATDRHAEASPPGES